MNTQMIKAVEMTRSIREQHYQRLSGKSHRERIAFYREQARKMETRVPILLRDKTTIAAVMKPETIHEDS
jgi:hypothetical protein